MPQIKCKISPPFCFLSVTIPSSTDQLPVGARSPGSTKAVLLPHLSSKMEQGKQSLHVNTLLCCRSLWLTELGADCCQIAVLAARGFFWTFTWQDETDKRILVPMLWIITHCQQRIHSAHILKGTLSKIYVLLLYSPNGNPGLLAITHHLCLTYKVPHKRSWHTMI